MRLGYKRVGKGLSVDEDELRELLDVEKLFIDHENRREQLTELLKYGMTNDVMVVESIYDISSVQREIMDTLQNLAIKNMFLESVTENFSTDNQGGDFINLILSAMGYMEGKEPVEYSNTPVGNHSLRDNDEMFEELYEQYRTGHLSPVMFRKKMGVSREELDKLIEDYENNR